MDIIYYVGHLAIDREKSDELNKKAIRMQQAVEAGKVVLYQKRCLQGFEYHCCPIKGA
jgi:hypothetical protein